MLPAPLQKFNNVVKIKFEDGSKATFEYAFFKIRGEFYDVYTEHCGYHSFYSPSCEISQNPYGKDFQPPGPEEDK